MGERIVATRYGTPADIEVVSWEPPSPAAAEVTIAVRAAAINPADHKTLADGDAAALPRPVGFEAAGVVTAVGADVRGPAGPIAVGDEVVAFRIAGAYASAVTVRARDVLPKPAPLSFEAASGLLLAGTSAAQALDAVGVPAGGTILLHGASGAVGVAFLQLARAAGVRVIGTASTGRAAVIERFGGEPVEYGDGLLDRVRAIDAVDAAVDASGTQEAIDVSLALVADRRRIATVAAIGPGLAAGVRVLGNAPGAERGTAFRDAARIDLVRLAERGGFEVPVARVLPLAEARGALELVRTGRPGGKVVLVP